MAAESLKGREKASELNFEVIEEAAFTETPKSLRISGSTFPEDLSRMQKNLFTEITQ